MMSSTSHPLALRTSGGLPALSCEDERCGRRSCESVQNSSKYTGGGSGVCWQAKMLHDVWGSSLEEFAGGLMGKQK